MPPHIVGPASHADARTRASATRKLASTSCGSRREARGRSRPCSPSPLAAPALASEQHPTQSELEAELVCPTCHDDARRVELADRAADEGRTSASASPRAATKSQIIDELVGPPNNLGAGVLGVPQKHGFDLLAWLLPFVGIALGAVGSRRGAWYWSRNRDEAEAARSCPRHGGPPLDPELERRVDEELARFDA